jgi:hypothetical protein
VIVDDLRAASSGFRVLAEGSHIIRVPFEVCPFTRQPDGIPGLWWKEGLEGLGKMIPRRPDNTLDCSWWRPPFNDLIICSEKAEAGCMLVLTQGAMPPGFIASIITSQERAQLAARASWQAIVALVALDEQDSLPFCVLGHHLFSVDGSIYGAQGTQHKITAYISQLLRNPGSDDLLPHTKLWANQLAEMWQENPKHHNLDIGNSLAAFSTTCALMCCKNIVQAKETPHSDLQKARRKRGRLPLVSYHVLKVRSISARNTSPRASRGNAGEPLAVHWVRGHFKHYTESAPLLGRAVGTFWWSPHLAGRDASRVVHKDYEVEE